MQIDWFTYGAQIVNFLILVYLLRRFLYGPIQMAMTTRAEHLRAQFAAAAQKADEAEALEAKFMQQQTALDAEKATILADAMADVDRRRRAMILEARTEVESMQNRWYAAVEQDKADFLHEMRIHINDQLFDMARKVLCDLAHVELEAAMVTRFCAKLAELDSTTRHSVAKALNHSAPCVVINTNFQLAEPLRQQVERAVHELFAGETVAGDLHLRYKENPALISGIELVVQDRRLAWSVDDHLVRLEKQLSNTLDDALAARDNHGALLATAEV